MSPFVRTALAATVFTLPFTAARADEGMWTFDAFPAAKMQAEYGWAPDQAWLDKVRAAAVRLTGGCSASFVSGEGLILTNHHCVASCVEDNSTAKNNILAKGFTAATRARELKCAGQQAEVVTAISDVTGQVKAAIGSATGEAAVKARNAAASGIEKAELPRQGAHPLPGGVAVRRRPVQALHLPQIFGRSARLGARGAGRAIRRRPRQFQLPALLDGCELPSRLRERQAGGRPRRTCSGTRARRSRTKSPSSSATRARPSGCSPPTSSRSSARRRCRSRSPSIRSFAAA